jgi:stalled ribosome rescue protein Dom34
MKKIRQLGIWMDHSNAYLLELSHDAIIENIIVSDSYNANEEYSSEKHEKQLHTKEQHHQSEYYRKISDAIRNYDQVVLFGPTEAKNELLNLLQPDHLFDNIKIDVKNCDKMTENQMHSFVMGYFKHGTISPV